MPPLTNDLRTQGSPRPESLPLVVWAVAAFHLLLHLATNGRYGIFRDEYYYLACADHLAWGYVDHPPLSIALLAVQKALLGDSVHAIRILPGLAGAALIVLAAVLARELGGGRFAQGLAALCVAIVPQYLVVTGFYSMNALDLLFWAVSALLVVRIVRTDDKHLWLLFGVVAGLGLLNKISMLFFGAGLAVALVLTPLRRHLLRPQIWLGGLVALAFFVPHIFWQVRNDWPTQEFIRNATRYKIADISPLQFLLAQGTEIHPWNAPVWIAGLWFLLAGREGRRFRALGIIYLVALAVMALQKSKPYYLGPAYPMLLAAGAVALERWTAERPWLRFRPAVVALLTLWGAVAAPLLVPLLPVETLIAYQRTLGIKPAAAEKQALGPLPQYFADRFGWEELAQAVASVYDGLSQDERRAATIVAGNYGEAGALRYHGRRYGLPPAVSQHNNFYLWGPGPGTGAVVIAVGIPIEDVRDAFESVTVGPRIESPYAMPYETQRPILVCRGLKIPLADAWRRGKRYI
ncbi:MAG: glycosyltransferase family 39 protein [Solirubrobacterales bacterium]|jgi:hypothetical protein